MGDSPKGRGVALLVLFLFVAPGGDLPWCAGPQKAVAATASGNASVQPQWYLIPQDDLAVFEAFEYAIDILGQKTKPVHARIHL